MAGTVEFEATESRREFSVEISDYQQVCPTIEIRAVTDYSGEPVRCTRRPALNGCTLADELLTGSILTLRPNGTGVWVYDGGFNGYDPATPIDETNNPSEYLKYKWDPAEGRAGVFEHLRVRWLSLGQRGSVVYRIRFPSQVAIKAVRLITGYRNLEQDGEIHCILSRDPDGREVIGRYTISAKTISPPTARVRFSHPVDQERTAEVEGYGMRFDGVDAHETWLTLTSNGKSRHVWLSPVHITAWLDTAELELPVLKRGENTLVFTDAEDSSHRARITLSWPEAAQKEQVLASFEQGLDGCAAGNNATIALNRGLAGGAAKGQGYLTASLQPVLDREGMPQHADVRLNVGKSNWTSYNRFRIAVNTDGASPEDKLKLGLYSRPGGYSHLVYPLGKTDGWREYSVDISNLPRSHVRWLAIKTHGLKWKGEKPFTLYIDDIRLTHEEESGEQEQRSPLDGLTADQRGVLKKNILKWRDAPSIPLPEKKRDAQPEDYFPMGVWGGYGDSMRLAEALGLDKWDGVRAVMNDLRAHNMNSIAGSSQPFLEDDGRYLDILEQAGIRSWLYGPAYYHDQGSDPANRHHFEHRIAPAAREIAPRYRGRWGILIWGLTEEIPESMVPHVARYHELMEEIDPTHKSMVLYNYAGPARRAAELIKPPVLAMDRYPFRHTWSGRELANFADTIDRHDRIARSINVPLWVVLQSYGDRTLTPGGNYFHTRQIVHPLQMKAQAWVAVAHGAKGLYAYFYKFTRQPGRNHYTVLKTETGEDTPAYRAWTEALGEIRPHTDLLIKLQRQDQSVAKADDPKVEVSTFVARPAKEKEAPGTYLIAVNTDRTKERTFSLTCSLRGKIRDLKDGRELSDEECGRLVLPPASGRIFRVE